jgi:hypothetical protein
MTIFREDGRIPEPHPRNLTYDSIGADWQQPEYCFEKAKYGPSGLAPAI